MKIKNEWQYRHAKSQAKNFADVLANFDERPESHPGVHQKSSFKTWLSAVARHHVERHLRKGKWLQDSKEVVPETMILQAHQETEVLFIERRAILQTAIGQLTDHERQLLQFGFIEGLSAAEAADKLRIKPESVRREKCMLRKKIRRLIESRGGGVEANNSPVK